MTNERWKRIAREAKSFGRRIPLAVSLLGSAFLVVGSAPGQSSGGLGQEESSGPKTPNRKNRPPLKVTVPRVEKGPKIDGFINDEIWRTAARIGDFSEVEPSPGAAPRDSTVAYVAYDRHYLFIAVLAYGEPRQVRASVANRDKAYLGYGYDGVTLRLDTFNDGRRAYVLQSNPRGVQVDGFMTEGGYPSNTENYIWDVGSKITDFGYTMEFAIPFSSLNFPTNKEIEIGFNILRDYAELGRQDSWSPRARGNPCDICQQGILVGIRDVDSKKSIDVRPYVVGAEAGGRAMAYGFRDVDGTSYPAIIPGGWSKTETTRRVGADIRWGLSSANVINATINPDFSQVEASPAQVQVNRRFAIYYPELRPFFTAETGVFETGRRESSFYTRSITDPSVGARFTGRSGGLHVAALYARDRHPVYSHYQDYEYSFTDETVAGAADDAALRVRQDFGKDSHFGLLAVRRQHAGGFNQVIGGDLRYRLGRLTLAMGGEGSIDRLPEQFAATDTAGACPMGFDSLPGEPGRCRSLLYDGAERTGSQFDADLSYRDAIIWASVTASRISPTFRAQLGNIYRVGTDRLAGLFYGSVHPKKGSATMISGGANLSSTWGYDGEELDLHVAPNLSVMFANGITFNAGPSYARTRFLDSTLESKSIRSTFGLRSKVVTLNGSVSLGEDPIFDFSGPRVGRSMSLMFYSSLDLSPSFSITPYLIHTVTSEKEGGQRVARADILSLTTQYLHTPRLGFRSEIQLSDQWSGITTNPLMQRNAYLISTFLMTYEVAPTSFLYFGVNNHFRRFEAPVVDKDQLLTTGMRVFFKLSYLFRL